MSYLVCCNDLALVAYYSDHRHNLIFHGHSQPTDVTTYFGVFHILISNVIFDVSCLLLTDDQYGLAEDPFSRIQ
jgi:hypothetical protein